jgi:hypothetical protein
LSIEKNKPFLIHFDSHGSDREGMLTVAQNDPRIPFEIKRIFWVVDTPVGVARGRHAHRETEMVLIAVRGSIEVEVESRNFPKQSFKLDSQNTGLFLPILTWHTMRYSPDAIQLVLASAIYRASDYIRDYNEFLKLL